MKNTIKTSNKSVSSPKVPFSEQNYKEIVSSTESLECKLIQIKLDYAHKSEEIEEIKDVLVKLKNNVISKDNEIMRLNKDIEKIIENFQDERDINKPPRVSMGSPKNAIFLKRKKN